MFSNLAGQPRIEASQVTTPPPPARVCASELTSPPSSTGAHVTPATSLSISGTVQSGRTKVLINPDRYDSLSDKKKIALIAHEMAHAIGFAHPYQSKYRITGGGTTRTWTVNNCPDSLSFSAPNRRTSDPDNIPGISTRLANALKAANTSAYEGSLLLSAAECWGDVEETAANLKERVRGFANTYSYSSTTAPALTTTDLAVYKEVYTPGAATIVSAERYTTTNPLDNKVEVSWISSTVHVEKGFDVQVKVNWRAPLTGTGWTTIATVGANVSSAIFDQPTSGTSYSSVVTSASTRVKKGSYGTYRVVSTTGAFGSTATPATSSISGEVKHERPLLPSGGGGGGGVVTPPCTSWGYYLAWVSADGTTGSIRPTGFTSLASARANLASAKFFLSGAIDPGSFVTITSAYTFCAGYGSASALSESESASVQGESSSSVDTNAALDALETCLDDATTGLEVNACMATFEEAVTE